VFEPISASVWSILQLCFSNAKCRHNLYARPRHSRESGKSELPRENLDSRPGLLSAGVTFFREKDDDLACRLLDPIPSSLNETRKDLL
jgi:hypothetical protein